MKNTLLAFTLAGIATTAFAANSAVPSYVIDTIAGSSLVGDGGMALSAALGDAQGVATDRAGNIYVSDTFDNRVRKIAPSGLISTVAGNGFAGSSGDGGLASAAQLSSPYGLAADSAGNLYIADLGNNRIRKITPDGMIATLVINDKLQSPRNVAVDAAGYIYVSEFDAQRVRKISPGGVVTLLAGSGEKGFKGDGGPAVEAALSYPTGLALDHAGRLYIVDSGNNRVRRVESGQINTVLGSGQGSANSSVLATPTGVAVDSAGNVYIADTGNHRIRKLTPAGVMSTTPVDGRDLAFDSGDNLYVAGGARVMKVTAAGAIVTFAGDGSYGLRGDGAAASSARLSGPAGIALSAAGELFFADQNNRRVRRIPQSGVIATVAVGARPLSAPSAVAFDISQRLYVADSTLDNIFRIDQAGQMSVLAGLGVPSFLGDGGPATTAALSFPTNLAFDIRGNLYVADTANHRVRKISPEGFISTVAGNGVRGYNGDGQPATSSQLDTPNGVVMDNAGYLYIADSGNQRIRKVTPAGDISTIAGSGAAKFSGDENAAVQATFNWPRGLALDGQGNLIIADSLNHRVRMITPDGLIHSIAGDGLPYFGGDGGPASVAHLNSPWAVAVDAAGSIFVSDRGNNRIRKLTLTNTITPPSPVEESERKVSVVHRATLLPGPVTAGELLSIFGASVGIGDSNPFGDTKVFFDGERADLFYAQTYQVNVQAPYSIAGKAVTQMEIVVMGLSLGKTTLTVVDSAPGIFTSNGSGTGPAAATNQDGSPNSASNPAPRGSVVILYGSGEGQTDPPGRSATPAADPLPKPVLPVRLAIGGIPAQILFAGAAPGLVGVLQINVRVPAGLSSGALPVALQIGNSGSQIGVTLAVQ